MRTRGLGTGIRKAYGYELYENRGIGGVVNRTSEECYSGCFRGQANKRQVTRAFSVKPDGKEQMFLSNYAIWDEFEVHMGLGSGKVSFNSRVMVRVNCIGFIIKSKVPMLLVSNTFGSVSLQMTNHSLSLVFSLSECSLDE